MPYLYSLGYQTYRSGAPFMRALFMDFPDDPQVAGLTDEYMLGPAFLAAPTETRFGSRSTSMSAMPGRALSDALSTTMTRTGID